MRYLFFIVLVIISAFAAAEKDISAVEAYQLLSNKQLVLVDVRSVSEWKQSGVAENSLTISIHQPGGIAAFTTQLLSAVNDDKNTPIGLICASGVRSSKVQQYLAQKGFTNVINVPEGMIGNWYAKGWIEQGLPVVPYEIQ